MSAQQSKDYFHIDLDELPNGTKALPVTLYLYQPITRRYIVALKGNVPLVEQKRSEFRNIIDRGGKLAIQRSQLKTYLIFTGKIEGELKPVSETGDTLGADGASTSEDFVNSDKKVTLAELNTQINDCYVRDDYTPLIRKVRDEILKFPKTISPSTTLATKLTRALLLADSLNNRIVTVSYLIARVCGIDSEAELGDLLCAAFLHNIGYTQLDSELLREAQIDYSSKEERRFKKHPGLAHHLIKKSGIDLSERCLQIIQDHQERFDGRGYPQQKTGHNLDPLALILGVTKHLFEFSEGKLTGKRTPMGRTVALFSSKTKEPGLQFEFGNSIREAISSTLRGRA